MTPAFAAQVHWLMTNRVSKNIVIVAHEGDVVDNGRDVGQWTGVLASLNPLISSANTVLPFSINRMICNGHTHTEYQRSRTTRPRSRCTRCWRTTRIVRTVATVSCVS